MRYLKILLACFLLTTAAIHAEVEEAVVTADVLRVRESADLKAESLFTLKRGTIVRILSKSTAEMTIDGITASWFQIESEGKKGWTFGGFMSEYFQKLSGGNLVWKIYPPNAPYEEGLIIVLFNTKTKKEQKVKTNMETADFKFSENLRYLALDQGTDVSGGIQIIDLANKAAILVNDSYMPRHLVWKGNSLSFDKILCLDDGLWMSVSQ
ncbi:MAG: hypothetical protein LDLANPLL_00943 [Turneriella sp.]|nr:hypothetical protein [Turneriella sp.]